MHLSSVLCALGKLWMNIWVIYRTWHVRSKKTPMAHLRFHVRTPQSVRQQLCGSSRMKHMTLEQILARAQALITEEVEVDQRCCCGGRGDAEFFLMCLWAHLQPPTNRTQSQCSATSVKVPITLPETTGSPGGKSRRALPEIHCYQCQQQGLVTSRCPENEARGKRPALLSPHIN